MAESRTLRGVAQKREDESQARGKRTGSEESDTSLCRNRGTGRPAQSPEEALPVFPFNDARKRALCRQPGG